MMKWWQDFQGWPAWVRWALAIFVLLIVVGALVPPDEESAEPERAATATHAPASATDTTATQELRRERARLHRERVALRRERAAARRARARRRRAAIRRHAQKRRAAAARRQEQERERALLQQRQEEEERQEEEQQADCHPSYDPCLDPTASDYDCAGGSGDGPMYTGSVTVKDPSDPYDLDRNGDGHGCD